MKTVLDSASDSIDAHCDDAHNTGAAAPRYKEKKTRDAPTLRAEIYGGCCFFSPTTPRCTLSNFFPIPPRVCVRRNAGEDARTHTPRQTRTLRNFTILKLVRMKEGGRAP